MNDDNKLTGHPLVVLLLTNIALTIGLAWWMLLCLQGTEIKYTYLREISRQQDLLAKTEKLLVQYKDSLPADQVAVLVTEVKNTEAKLDELYAAKSNSDSVNFYDILLMMLLAGSLGGVLCNLRGFFMHYRGDDQSFPKNLEIPYYTRAFLGGGAGLFIYFVASFLITSVTTEQTSTNVSFQGMVTFIALAMLAGFGSLEFFQRLKETCMAMFGQKAEKEKWEKLQELHAKLTAGIITQVEYDELKKKYLATPEYDEVSKRYVPRPHVEPKAP